MTITHLRDGWVRHEGSGGLRRDYWIDGFPTAPTESSSTHFSPISNYDAGSIPPVQWINHDHDKAAVLAADGDWKTGGQFHVWYSAGGATRPREITPHAIRYSYIEAGDPSGWLGQVKQAVHEVEAYLGLIPAPREWR